MSVASWLGQLVKDNPTLLPATVTAIGVIVGVVQFVSLAQRDRKRRTLEACERFILGTDTADRWERLQLALGDGTFPHDTDPPTASSPRLDVSRLLNHLATICTGARRGFYSRSLVRSYLAAYETQLYDNFLRQEPPAALTSYFWDASFDEVRRVFGRPPFVPEPPLAAAARLARSFRNRVGAAAAAGPDGDAADVAAFADAIEPIDQRVAARLRYLLGKAERIAIKGG